VYLFEETSEKDQALIDDKKLNELTSMLDKKSNLNYCVSGYCTPTSYGYTRYNEGHSVVVYKAQYRMQALRIHVTKQIVF